MTTIAAIDVGGTFTDGCVYRAGQLHVCKVPSTPADPSIATLEVLNRLGGADLLVHGTTVATNALLQGRLARTVLVTTKGMRDVLAIGRQNRDPHDLYSLSPRQRTELIPRELRVECEERIAPDGSVETPLVKDEIARLAATVEALQPEAIAVCLLHSYANPTHELLVKDALAGLLVPVVCSSELSPEFREFERMLVTAANAALIPVTGEYLRKLQAAAAPTRVVIMHSTGGWLPPSVAAAEPVRLVLSGPAGGVAGAAAALELAGLSAGLAIDVGGTSSDVALVKRPASLRPVTHVAGLPLKTPSLEIETIGSGGGSIARLDAGGALVVGPESAGAVPGPACYARGGEEATLCDALVALGRIPPDTLLGGETPIHKELALKALRKLVPDDDPVVTADGIVQVAVASMERALRKVTVERGVDPADLSLVPFGGAGGSLACDLAERVGCKEILVPPHPGLLSAIGMLAAPAARDLSRGLIRNASSPGLMAELREVAAELGQAAAADLSPSGADNVVVTVTLDARYVGQSFELTVGFIDGWRRLFDEFHGECFGVTFPGREVEVVAVRVRAEVEGRGVTGLRRALAGLGDEQRANGVTPGGTVTCRDLMAAGEVLTGPAVMTELSSCFWLGAGWQLTVRESGMASAMRVRV